MADTSPYLSVVIPAYNEAHRLRRTLPHAVDFLRTQGFPFEILVVDNGSTDATCTPPCGAKAGQ